jgi:hypothetical protein
MATSFTRDGISYSIAVSTSQGAYFATWTCTKCKVTGVPTHECESTEEAIARAQARSFSEHHLDRHVKVSEAAIRRVKQPT